MGNANKSLRKATKGRPPEDPSAPSSTQLLLQRLATRPPPPEPKAIQPLPQLPPQPPPIWRTTPWLTTPWLTTPWLWTREQWHPYHGYHLAARYKWFYVLRQTPRFLLTIVILSLTHLIIQGIKQMLYPSPPPERQTPERSLLGRAIFNSLAAEGNVTVAKAINELIKPWGKITTVKGISMFPTFTGDREVLYSSYKRSYGQGLQAGEIISFVHPSREDAYMLKRVRALEGEAFYQRLRVERWGSCLVEVPPEHCYVLGDNAKVSNDSRSFGAIPLDSIASIAIWRWDVNGFHWVKHGRKPWWESLPRDPNPKVSRKREVLDDGPPARKVSPKATIVIPKRLPKDPVMKD